jgi:hypothetical protein
MFPRLSQSVAGAVAVWTVTMALCVALISLQPDPKPVAMMGRVARFSLPLCFDHLLLESPIPAPHHQAADCVKLRVQVPELVAR